MKKDNIIYKILYFFSMLTLFIPLLCVIFLIYLYLKGHIASNPATAIPLAAAIIILGISHFVIEKQTDKYRERIEYDEFGNRKGKGRYDMSKEEREIMDLQRTVDMERIISKSILEKITHKGSVKPREDLDKLIGLIPVKQKVLEMVARIEFEKKDRKSKKNKDSSSGRHMVFYGAPGTGKTTVARIITGFLYQNKYIKENKCVEIDGNMLKANSPGETVIKTQAIIRRAYGGVLFIDEAYILAEGNSASGKEAIATLIKEMEDNRDKFVLILAGYTQNMKDFLNVNPGFESRIKEYINFPDYTLSECVKIFIKMAQTQHFTVAKNAIPPFIERIKNEKKTLSYGNARTIRNILDEALDKHAYNFINKKLPAADKYRIRAIDISTDTNRDNLLDCKL